MPLNNINPTTSSFDSRLNAVASAGGSSFVPSDIAGLLVWFKADAITGKVDGNTITQWDDSSGNAYHANTTNGTGGSAPTYKTNIINSLPVVRFSSNKLETPSITGMNTNMTVFIVIKGSTTGYPVSFDTSSSQNAIIYGFTANKLEIFNNPRLEIGDFNVFAYGTILRKSSSAETTVRKNGTQTNTNASVPTTSAGAITIGARGGGAEACGCDIAELIMYDSYLSSTNYGSVESYLATKYGL